MQQAAFTIIYREVGKFPLYNMCKPDECTYIKKLDWTEAFLGVQNIKTCIMKLFVNDIQILFWKWKLGFS